MISEIIKLIYIVSVAMCCVGNTILYMLLVSIIVIVIANYL